MSAGKVFTLEDRLKILQERVNRVDRMSPEENIIDLEDKIALTIAQVAQSESQVNLLVMFVRNLNFVHSLDSPSFI